MNSLLLSPFSRPEGLWCRWLLSCAELTQNASQRQCQSHQQMTNFSLPDLQQVIKSAVNSFLFFLENVLRHFCYVIRSSFHCGYLNNAFCKTKLSLWHYKVFIPESCFGPIALDSVPVETSASMTLWRHNQLWPTSDRPAHLYMCTCTVCPGSARAYHLFYHQNGEQWNCRKESDQLQWRQLACATKHYVRRRPGRRIGWHQNPLGSQKAPGAGQEDLQRQMRVQPFPLHQNLRRLQVEGIHSTRRHFWIIGWNVGHPSR